MAQQHKPETFLLSPGAESSLPQQAQIALQQVDNLKYFLISAPVDWTPDQCIRRFLLPTGDYVSCVLWSNLFHITGTDIVRCLAFRFQAFGRPVKNAKKFEEGIFSDLRNLKAGTDASLEEPKSPFLDFLYKNNCIRTQKKQKVFYWYSVPHDRLFLDALERDLKREKMGQESTTAAVNEPALSFEFDSSQSLFEQLTKSQQTNTSTFPGPHQLPEYSQPAPPAVPASASVPPPQMVSQAMQHAPEEALNDMSSYSQMTMPMTATSMPAPLAPTTNPMHSDHFPAQLFYDRNGVPVAHSNQRHNSVPAYMESSPAPSFVSSQSYFDDFSTRGVSYEPITPPQHGSHYTPEPQYVPSDDLGFYNPGADLHTSLAQSAYCQGQQAVPQYQPSPRSNPAGVMYSHIEGSPTYKQRRRRSSLNTGFAAASAAAQAAPPKVAHTVRRPSDLRRSVSASVAPGEERHVVRAASMPMTYQTMPSFHPTPDVSRQGTPLPSVEDQMAMHGHSRIGFDDVFEPVGANHEMHAGPGVFRRARSATTNDTSPYPHKAHTCPIPTCGRTFKRLEHLKRHVRTHTQDRPYVCSYCNKSFSRSDNLAQHRRTHESLGDLSFGGTMSDEFLEQEETPIEEESDQLSGLTSAEPGTPEHLYLQGPMQVAVPPMPPMSDFDARTSMPPPPLPLSVQGY